jgi:serine protease AprX
MKIRGAREICRTMSRSSSARRRIRNVAFLSALCMVLALGPFVQGTSMPIASGIVETSLLAKLQAAPDATYEVLMTYRGSASDAVAALEAANLVVPRVFGDFHVAYAQGTGSDVLRAAANPLLRGIVENRVLDHFGTTDTVATRARESWDAKSTSTSPVLIGGNVVDGTGVGVAIVDSGIDGTHPDLVAAMGTNLKFVCPTPGLSSGATDTCYGNAVLGDDGCNIVWQPLADTDTSSGHGTHVAGIVAGDGTASDGRVMGTAPGATLYGLSVGEGLSILFALEAFNWVHCHYNAVTPNIRVVSNSWGIMGGSAYSASDPIVIASNTLVADGITVLFAVGNDGGTGNGDVISGYAKNPTPGVIGVASYNDAGTATRSGTLSDFSSRGKSTDTVRTHWPDVSAPGDLIDSTWGKPGPVCLTGPDLLYEPYYCTLSGTSMATPHTAGVVALLLQANGALSPAVIEDVLEDRAVQFTTPGGYVSDSSNPTNGVNFGAGHGLIDAIASLADGRVLGSGAAGSPLPQVSQNPHVYTEDLVDGQVVHGVEGVVELQWAQVAGRPVSLSERSLESGNTATYPLSLGQTANFRVDGPGPIVNVPDTLTADSALLQMDALYTFPGPGSYEIESQIDFGSGLVSFDNFVVHVVG